MRRVLLPAQKRPSLLGLAGWPAPLRRWSTNARAAEEVDGAIRTRTTLTHVIARAYEKIRDGRTKRGVGLSCLQESFSVGAKAAGEKRAKAHHC